MATADDDAWLYGDSHPDKKPPPAASDPDKEAGELSGDEADKKTNKAEQQDDQEDDSDSDDDVQVTIGDIKPQTSFEAQNKFRTGYSRPSATGPTSLNKNQPKIDIEAPGTINGENTIDFAPDSLEADDKPWRKPGADITDYFNYGFSEDLWTRYSDKQRKLRMENSGYIPQRMMFMNNPKRSDSSNKPLTITADAGGASGEPLSPGQKKSAGPPPQRKSCGTIDVIGGTTYDSRRPHHDYSESEIPSAEAQDFRKYPIQTTVTTDHSLPMMNVPPPDYSAPPPGMMPIGPMGMAPPHIAPHMMNIPPPNMAGPPPGFLQGPPPIPADPYESFYPPGVSGPPPNMRGPGFDPQFGFGPPGSYGSSSGPPAWESRDNYGGSGWGYNQGPPRPGSDISSSDDESSRNRYRDRPHRDHDRDRYRSSRGHERSGSVSRGERRHRDYDRDREDRHRSRRKRDEDDDHHKSKHKKSKHSRRDKEESTEKEGSVPREDQPT